MEGTPVDDNIITIGMFIQYLTHYIKMGIFINKGTDNNALLERCIKLYNKYKKLEAMTEISPADEIFVKKCLKRFNLILKVDSDFDPVDIQDKSNQGKIISLSAYPALQSGNLKEIIKYSTKHKIDIFTNIPLLFMLKAGPHQQLLWLYTRALFYISQLILSKTHPDADQTHPTIIQKNKIYNESLELFMSILEQLESTESNVKESNKLNKQMALDNFLNNKLIKTGINEENINVAKNEVKEIFQKKGLTNNPAMNKMIDVISNKLENFDAMDGNLVQNMVSMARTVADEMRPDLENDPDAFQNTLGSITEIFQDMMNNQDGDGEKMPEEFRNVMGIVKSMADMDPNGNAAMAQNMLGCGGDTQSNNNMNEIIFGLDQMIISNGMDREIVMNAIRGNNGEIDLAKLQEYMSKL